LVVPQATLPDGSALDARTLKKDGLAPAEIDIGRGWVAQAPMIAPVIVSLDKRCDLSLQRANARPRQPFRCAATTVIWRPELKPT